MTENYRTVTTADDGAVSGVVAETVAEVKGCGLTDLDPLYGAIDPDALDALFDERSDGDGDAVGITFEYSGCRVTVERGSDDAVVVTATPGDELA